MINKYVEYVANNSQNTGVFTIELRIIPKSYLIKQFYNNNNVFNVCLHTKHYFKFGIKNTGFSNSFSYGDLQRFIYKHEIKIDYLRGYLSVHFFEIEYIIKLFNIFKELSEINLSIMITDKTKDNFKNKKIHSIYLIEEKLDYILNLIDKENDLMTIGNIFLIDSCL